MLLSQLCLLRDTASCLSLIPALPKLLHDRSQALATNAAPAHRFEMQQLQKQKPAILSVAVPSFCCGLRQNLHCALLLLRVQAAAPQQLLASVAETLPPSLPLPLRHGVRASCNTALSLFYPVYAASLFLEIHSCGCLKLHRRKNLLELPPTPPKLFIGKGQIIVSSVACSPVSHYLLWHSSGGKKNKPPFT